MSEVTFEERMDRREKKRSELLKKKKGTFREACYIRRQVSSGNYALDKALYSGFHFGRIHEVFGGESSGKTTASLIAAAQVNKINYETGKLDLTYSNPCSVMFADMEETADESWEQKLGFMRRMYGNNVDYICGGDVACDTVKDLISDDIYSMIIVDCTDQFYPLDILEGEIGMNDLGMKARTLSKTMRKWQTALAQAQYRNKGFPWRIPAIILLSHGTPIFMDQHGRWESDAGNQVRFYSSVRIYLSKLKIQTDSSASHGIGAMQATIKKNKLNTAGHIAKYDIALKDLDNLKAGQIDNIKAIMTDLNDWEMCPKTKKGYEILGGIYKTKKEFKEKMYTEPEFLYHVWNLMTEKVNSGVVTLDVEDIPLSQSEEQEADIQITQNSINDLAKKKLTKKKETNDNE